MSRIARALVVLTCVTLAFATTAAHAQRRYYAYDDSPRAATVGESHARGMADVIRSSGDAALSASSAALNLTDARSRQLDNDLKNTQTYFAKRQINKENTYRQRNHPTEEQVFRLARERAPDRLGPTSMDPVTGQITWHFVLEEDVYAPNRVEIQELYTKRAEGDHTVTSRIRNACRNTQSKVRQNREKYTPEDFVGALKFLDSLNYEARFSG